jgi:hypothetical protein
MGRVLVALLGAAGVFWLLTKRAGRALMSYYGGLNQRSAYGPQAVPWLTPTGARITMDRGAESSWVKYGAISLKIMDGKQGPGTSSPWDDRVPGGKGMSNKEIIEKAYAAADAAGCARWSWGFHYMQTEEVAAAEGRAAGEAALRYNVAQYSCNCESVWIAGLPGVFLPTGENRNSIEKAAITKSVPSDLIAKGWKYIGATKVWAPPSHLRKTAAAFREAFKDVAPGVRLHICPVGPPSTTRAWEALDAENLSKWDGLDRMIFGSWRKWYPKKYQTGKELSEAARALNPSFAYIPMPAAGPHGSGYSGSVQGWVDIMETNPWPAFGIFFGNYGHGWVTPENGNIPWDQAMDTLHTPPAVGDLIV